MALICLKSNGRRTIKIRSPPTAERRMSSCESMDCMINCKTLAMGFGSLMNTAEYRVMFLLLGVG